MIRIGKPAPAVSAEAYVRGEPGPQVIGLAALRGSWVVLCFYPRDFTFVCPTELQELARLHDTFAGAGAVVLAASTDSYFSHKAWFEEDPRLAAVAYPVLADTSHAVSAAFGVLTEDGAALRGSFIIDLEGIIRHLAVNDLVVGRDIEETVRVLAALQTGALCPVARRPGAPTLSRDGGPADLAA